MGVCLSDWFSEFPETSTPSSVLAQPGTAIVSSDVSIENTDRNYKIKCKPSSCFLNARSLLLPSCGNINRLMFLRLVSASLLRLYPSFLSMEHFLAQVRAWYLVICIAFCRWRIRLHLFSIHIPFSLGLTFICIAFKIRNILL